MNVSFKTFQKIVACKQEYSFENRFDPLFCEIGSVDRRHSLCSPRGQFYIMYLFWQLVLESIIWAFFLLLYNVHRYILQVVVLTWTETGLTREKRGTLFCYQKQHTELFLASEVGFAQQKSKHFFLGRKSSKDKQANLVVRNFAVF